MLGKWLLAGVALISVQVSPAMAETTQQELTLERIFGSPDLNGPRPRALKLSPDGTLVTLLKNRAEDRDRYDLWAIDTKTARASMLVDSAKIGSGAELSEEEKMQRERARIGGTRGIVAYDWAPDSKSLLVPLDGDLFLATRDGKVRRLTETKAGELNATISPKGGFVSFVRDQNLFALDLKSGQEKQLTRDGGGTLSWGVSEFVAQEEMDRTKGSWWSPDDARIAVARVEESGVMIVSRAAIGAEGTKVYDQRYPRAGTPNAKVDLYVMRADGAEAVKVDLGNDPDYYLARVDWLPDGSALIVQRENRAQTELELLKVDPATGKATPLHTETSKTWINLSNDLRALRDGSLIWTSERSGFSHIYHWKNGQWTQLTSGDWAVREVAGVDQAKGRVYFLGNRETPVEQHLYSVDIAKPGAITRLTEAGWWNTAVMDAGATRAIITRSNPSQPEQVYLADASGKRRAWIEENALKGQHPYAPFAESHVAPTFGAMKAADGSTLHYKLLTPKIEPGKRYPVFVQVYGGPGGGRQVTAGWGGGLHQYLVDRDWVVFSVDGRGTPDRGKAFEDQIHKAMGTVEVQDQLAGVAWLKQQAFVDPTKIAIYGWSYGGYMTLKLLEAAPGAYAAGISGAPVTRWELYDTHYTERYMGNPATELAPYAKSGVLGDATKIADPLLLIHGMADDNVVFENSTALMATLQQAGKPFETMVYPGQTHRVAGDGVSVHLWRTIQNFLDREVLGQKD
ncbi:S9 family peptidase [Sphingomonas cavernae]|uniref:S9 family peptidase n=1 Tax=Sphingomonas cavernae TaxID=2320861 RepID=A0A418WM09_9SPHN|nr:S9 family peptidase [Sphingomonas cavernae]RJF91037.1 S9 family peptidase [Sphingomonas cavernae]